MMAELKQVGRLLTISFVVTSTLVLIELAFFTGLYVLGITKAHIIVLPDLFLPVVMSVITLSMLMYTNLIPEELVNDLIFGKKVNAV
jgi:hypothetical protein